MRLSVKRMAAAAGLLWAGCALFTGALNLIWPPYGEAFLDLLRSMYPGYAAMTGLAALVVGTLYALLDGAICGALLAWLYNAVGGARQAPEPGTAARAGTGGGARRSA